MAPVLELPDRAAAIEVADAEVGAPFPAARCPHAQIEVREILFFDPV